MKYIKEALEQYGKETNFITYNIEKVLRLMDVLDFLFKRSIFKDKLILKGGTAINLIYTNMKRLSLDIDLDYHGSLEKEVAFYERTILIEELDKYMLSEQYEISTRSRDSIALLSRKYKYINAYGNVDYIKVDINFMDRISLFEPITSEITFFGKTIKVKTPKIEELFGMKIAALIQRSKPRDLYDSAFLLENITYDKDLLRKAAIFYVSLDGIFEIDNSTFENVKTIAYRDVMIELFPVLKKR